MSVKRTTILAHPTNYRVGRIAKVLYIVIHSGETGEGATPAEGMGNWFAQTHGPAGRSSAHKGVDTDSICTYVRDGDTAFGAPGVNATGWHLEHAGRAGQTASQWDDAASRLILANGALAAAEACVVLSIPARWLSDDQLRAGVDRGFITHAQASRVLGGTHWDPGPNFPTETFMAKVRANLTVKPPAPAPPKPPAPKPPADPRPRGLNVKTIDLRGAQTKLVTGPGVKPLQRLLAVPADGLAGAQTKAALIAAQRRVGVTADAQFGPATAEALLAGK